MRIFLFLDYDGTLVPIKSSPEKAVITSPVLKTLRELADDPLVLVSIVTGRSLRTMRSMIGLGNLVYAGNHGLEIEGPGIPYRVMAGDGCREIMSRIGSALRKELSSVAGVLVENKGLTLSLHFRHVDRMMLPYVLAALERTTHPYVKKKKVRINPGKEVLEVKPAVNWDKGKAVRWILKKYHATAANSFPVYIGDDMTDETAFAALDKRGMTVFVGTPASATAARYQLRNPRQVLALLATLKEVCCARQ